MSSASSQWRKRVKEEDPERYAEYLEKEKERSKRYRQCKMYSGMQQAADHSEDNFFIDNNFLGKINETYERYMFNTRKQKAHETMDDYISALCSLSSTCNFCDCLKDSLLRDRIVLGIKDSSTRKRLLQEADLNLETCIAMCRAAEATSPSQPAKTVTWTEDTTAVQGGSVSSGDQKPGKKQDFSMSLRRCDPMASPDEVEMPEVNFNTELDDSDDSALQWTTEHQSSGFPRDRTGHKKLEPAWSMSTSQPMSDNTSGSLLSLNTSHECYLCSAAFVLVSSLELHLASVHGEKLHMVLPGPSTPDRCDAGNYNKTDLDKEVDNRGNRQTKTEKKVGDSNVGDKTEKKRRQHMAGVCRKSFSKSFVLKRHKLIHGGKPFVCDVCSKSFTGAASLATHMRTHTGERPYQCPHCDSRFKQSSHLNGHIKSVHEGARPHVCDVCAKSFSSLGGLKSHLLLHSGISPFVCDTCNKSFSNACHLKAHKLIHTGCKPFVCEVCGKGFSQAGSLTIHKRIHTGERPYKCPHCDSNFKEKGHLQLHIKSVHEGAKPHVCDVCGAAFSDASNLKAHKRRHTGEKPYMCSDCGKCFTQSSSLAQHRLIHTGVKPHKCSYCGKGFTRSSYLTEHLLTHTGEKPHSCPHCPAAFRHSRDLKKHVQRKHQ